MTDNIQGALLRSAATLSVRTDALRDAFKETEDLLIEWGVGVMVSVPLAVPGRQLVWRKDKEWALWVDTIEGLGAPASTRLVHASREARVFAAEALPALLDAMLETAANTSAHVEKAVALVLDFNKQLASLVRTL